MAISWISALKMVPWSDVIQAAPTVLKAAKGLIKKNPEPSNVPPVPETTSTALQQPPANAGELALQQIASLEARVQQLEAAQRDANRVLEQMAEQQAQIVKTVGLLRTGATRLAWACFILGAAVVALGLYIVY